MTAILKTLSSFLALALVAGCASKVDAPTQYDLGLLPPAAATAAPALPAVSVADVNAPAWLDNNMMYFRLAYANQLQPRPYAASRWTMPPAQLFQQRLKSRLAQAGGTVLAMSDAALNIPLLRIDMDDFTQTFDTPSHSLATLQVRASLFNGRTLLAQKSFSRQAATPSADAAGAASAFVAANDGVIDELMSWLATVAPKK
ncbi:ABC-type transport auxiliary lipoprotein family protein [Collimonas sp. OK412]|jgi:cholesterol transport system auxiliary component|uniref:ABC-type transport auxiliary lipoprotein family protein n=1 Tax=Collimonas sp. (strain OK412) TaxID=1801619 RepID=UPI0008DEB833|nr:ABC-type transport auxiliary lipoprotein family protein [Collimonas sp. OK412]SFC21200.1 cholesterol transport system auxiliary component [Collimonas sp. OK412]